VSSGSVRRIRGVSARSGFYPRQSSFEGTTAVLDRLTVELTRRDYTSREAIVFDRQVFLVDGRLPMPALD